MNWRPKDKGHSGLTEPEAGSKTGAKVRGCSNLSGYTNGPQGLIFIRSVGFLPGPPFGEVQETTMNEGNLIADTQNVTGPFGLCGGRPTH